jgi:hypothetical protein
MIPLTNNERYGRSLKRMPGASFRQGLQLYSVPFEVREHLPLWVKSYSEDTLRGFLLPSVLPCKH